MPLEEHRLLPVLTQDGKKYTEPGKIPAGGWLKNSMIVPGSWKKMPSELKKGSKIWDQWRISDSFGFPSQWDSANSAWYRRDFQLKEIRKDCDYFLRFDGILRESWIFVNVTDYRRDENGRTFVNVGADQMGAQMGIWGVGIGANIGKGLKIGYNFNIYTSTAPRYFNNHEVCLGVNIFELTRSKTESAPVKTE